LQDALRPLPPARRYAVIGLLWVAWHFTNGMTHGAVEALQRLAWYVPLTCALSWLFGEASERSRSVLVAAALHAWVDGLVEFAAPGTYARVRARVAVLGLLATDVAPARGGSEGRGRGPGAYHVTAVEPARESRVGPAGA
jgi:hypothetical protein